MKAKKSFSAARHTFLQHWTDTVWKFYDCSDVSMHICCRKSLMLNVSIYKNSDRSFVVSGQISTQSSPILLHASRQRPVLLRMSGLIVGDLR